MGLQEQIAEAIIIAFDELGGDPQTAVDAALRHRTVEDWVEQEVTKISFAGGAEMIIPGLHLLTIPAGISYLIHKMATISWGIGALKGAYIVETAQYSDMRNILALWANASYYNAHILDHLAIDVDSFVYALSDEGYSLVTQASAKAQESGADNVVINTLHVLSALATDFTGDERAVQLVTSLAGNDGVLEAIQAAQNRLPENRNRTVSKHMTNRISTRMAMRLATRISARVPARLVVGWLPVAGAIVNAFFNAQTLRSMAETAEKYYVNQFTQSRLETLALAETNDTTDAK